MVHIIKLFLKKQLLKLIQSKYKLNNEVNESTIQIIKTTKKITEKEGIIKDYEKQIKIKEKKTLDYTKRIKDLENEIKNKDKTISEKEKQINDLKEGADNIFHRNKKLKKKQKV